MKRFSADPVLEELTDFQRRSVRHVLTQLYDVGSDRFLVADETGLGKSMVARGVIAGAIERLQDDPAVKRVDVVYVCANTDLAQQNLSRLNVTEDETISFSSRLTLLGKHATSLRKRRGRGAKPVNLVSFTPGTSFDMGYSAGKAEERAMLFLALNECLEMDGYQRTAAQRILQGTVRRLDSFKEQIDNLTRELGDDGIDPVILRQFRKAVSRGGSKSLLTQFGQAVTDTGRARTLPAHVEDEKWQLIRDLRAALARASVETLEPDLVILDEFQRFRHLLDTETPAGELADQLFSYRDAKVLLLSATPYKPFTYAEEHADDHATDFFRTLGFLAEGSEAVDPSRVRRHLDEYRREVVSGGDPAAPAKAVREELLRVMSRQERPRLADESMTVEVMRPAARVTTEDLAGYAQLQGVARLVQHERDHGLVTTEYWKSAPYFINFCDGYQLGSRVRAGGLSADALQTLLRTQHVQADRVRLFGELDGGNARMRDLIDLTVGRDLWKLLWIPPSLPYLQPAGPYADVTNVTKMLVFSSWAATPTSVASLLSYEAERRAADGTNYREYTPAARRRLTKPLNYSMSRGRPGRMSTLLLFWPMPGLAAMVDPLQMVSEACGRILNIAEAERRALDQIRQPAARWAATSEQPGEPTDDAPDSLWRFAFSLEGAWPERDLAANEEDRSEAIAALAGYRESGDDEDETPVDWEGIAAHVRSAITAREDQTTPATEAALTHVAQVALHSPGNTAFRALNRVLTDEDSVDDLSLFAAAAVLANGLRSLFNRPDVTKIVEQVTDPALPYWRKVLQYCAFGNLQSVLDEYLHHLRQDQFKAPIDDERLLDLGQAAADAMSLRTTTYQAIDVANLEDRLTFVPRFALRYGGRKQNSEDARQPEVRAAFNSPFWPFVLASTSVGQEGIDFHWWCHSVFHWNTPANPVDFEQREGRVDRYRGHAVRRNIATRHGRRILAAPGRDPWATAFASADDYCEEFGDFTPSWVFPGPAKVERHVAPFALSADQEKYDRLKQDVALYRLAFGQPRQEDMIELLRRRGLDADAERLLNMRINLAP